MLFLADVGIKEPDPLSPKQMHVAARIEELLEIDERGLIDGITLERNLSPQQIGQRRALGPEPWDDLNSGKSLLFAEINGQYVPVDPANPEEPWGDWEAEDIDPPARSPERVGMYPGTIVMLSPKAGTEVERIAKLSLQLPPSLQDRLLQLLGANLFDSAIRDLGAALEMRMRAITGTDEFGTKLIDRYIATLLDGHDALPARLNSLRQELRSVYKFIRNEFAHELGDLEPGRGYALVSRLCWHVRDAELVIHGRGL